MRCVEEVVRQPTSRHPAPFSSAERVTTLFCAEPLRPMACCVIDSLTARGWHATVETGDAARNALRRFRDPSVGLRVLCVAEALDAQTRTALGRALDPYDRRDLLIVHFQTPRAIIEAIEGFVGLKPARRKLARPLTRSTRSYLAHQTLVEQQVDLSRWSAYGVATAATTAALAVGLHFAGPSPIATTAQRSAALLQPTPAETAAPSPLVDDSVLSAVAPTDLDDDDDAKPQRRAPRPSAASASIRQELTPIQDADINEATPRIGGEPTDVEDLGELPLEDLDAAEPVAVLEPVDGVESVSPVAAVDGAPALRRAPTLSTADPFSVPSAP